MEVSFSPASRERGGEGRRGQKKGDNLVVETTRSHPSQHKEGSLFPSAGWFGNRNL